jgi:photosystem I P700 chlorophyll a apoprotein A1
MLFSIQSFRCVKTALFLATNSTNHSINGTINQLLSSNIWSKVGHFSKALSKGPNTTTWIWNFHADAHDFDIQHANTSRKVFASSLAHLSLVFLFIAQVHFHTAYFSSSNAWLKDPQHVLPSAHIVYQIVGQDILNSDVGCNFQGIYITSGIFQLQRSMALCTKYHLCLSAVAGIVSAILCILGSYSKMHISFSPSFNSISFQSLGLISWCGHQVHVCYPINILLDAHVDPEYIPCPQDLLFSPPLYAIASSTVISLHHIISHHLYLALFLSIIAQNTTHISLSHHSQLSLNLAIAGSSSIHFSHISSYYSYCSSDYPTQLCLFSHHIVIGCTFIAGAGAHASISMIRDVLQLHQPYQNHRDVIIGHLITICILLGFHSFGLYIHNDTLQALGRPEDIFSDNSIQLKPVFAIFLQQLLFSSDIELLQQKVLRMTQELGTADFLVHHIHAFTIHVSSLIILKAILYARTSRQVPDKLELGFRYPCDGPGRGGTCQISAWDHIFLAVFWVYNSLSVVLFHFFWKMQSDVWGIYTSKSIQHISGGDFSVNSGTINGWLRNMLWSQAAQVIQSYGTSISGYGLIFIGAHFLWAFSLMFLYSGRGYWQELIESILWAHHTLKIVTHIQPRALSISQGRAVGLIHYFIGGISCTWAFFISRMVALALA